MKRSLLTEGHGIPIGLAVDGANRHDMKLVRATLESMVVARPQATEDAPQGMCLDKGYDDDEVRAILSEFGFTAHIRSRGEEARELVQEAGRRARRWPPNWRRLRGWPHPKSLTPRPLSWALFSRSGEGLG